MFSLVSSEFLVLCNFTLYSVCSNGQIYGKILQNFVAFSEYMNFKLLDKIHKNWPQWASDPPRPAIEAQNRPTNLRGQEAEPRVFALLQKNIYPLLLKILTFAASI